MKKKIIIGTIIATAIVTVPATALAATYLPWTKNVYSISDLEYRENGQSEATVSTFDDMGNKCYVARADGRYTENSDVVSISCVRMSK